MSLWLVDRDIQDTLSRYKALINFTHSHYVSHYHVPPRFHENCKFQNAIKDQLEILLV